MGLGSVRKYTELSIFSNAKIATLYVGCTNNLQERIKEHNKSKKGAHYTKIRRPVILMHTEQFQTRSEALKRESQIKGWRREKKLVLINS